MRGSRISLTNYVWKWVESVESGAPSADRLCLAVAAGGVVVFDEIVCSIKRTDSLCVFVLHLVHYTQSPTQSLKMPEHLLLAKCFPLI
jgi:hypothetical protein